MERAAKHSIGLTFEANIDRVAELVAAHDELGTTDAPRPIQEDLLRSAVVLLHASLEDLLRSTSEHLLPRQGPTVLDEVGFPAGPDRTKSKFTLGELHPFKGRTVDEVIQAAVSARLQRASFNNVSEVAGTLERMGLSRSLLDPDQTRVEAMIKRRHLIVHRADRDRASDGAGVPLTSPIAKSTVDRWRSAVLDVGHRVILALPNDEGA